MLKCLVASTPEQCEQANVKHPQCLSWLLLWINVVLHQVELLQDEANETENTEVSPPYKGHNAAFAMLKSVLESCTS